MALLQETFTETLDAGAPSIKYEGDIQQEQKVARTLWDQLPNQVRMRFGSFEQFFSSGAWKKVLEAVQQQQQMEAPEQIQETEVVQEQAPQQGLGSMMPAPMAGGGIAGIRQPYFLGKLVKKITKPIKKIWKSPVGNAALLYAGTAGLGNLAGGLGGAQPWMKGKWLLPKNVGANLFGKAAQYAMEGTRNRLMAPETSGLLGKLKLTGGGGSKMPTALGWGALASMAPLAMSATGNWDTGAEEIDSLKNKAAEFGFDYSQMIRDIQEAVATGSEAEVAKVMTQYNLSRGDMPGSKYIGTAAEGGRIGYAEGGWEAREKQNLISKLVNMGLPLPQAMKMAEMIIANATPEELQSAIAGTRQQGLTPEESIKFQETIETPTEDISLTDQVSQYVPDIPQYKPVRRNVNQAMMGRMQRPEIGEMVMEKFRTPRGMEESVEEIRESLPEGMNEGGLMSLGGMEMDLRGGGFVPIGAKEKADDVPARLSKNEFVFTADAVRAAGDGNVDKGADKMYKTMKQLENRVG